ncbi:MAG: energy transducer TonB, partial [Spirochaetales bacterium]|nr:energy transducer TonB [Spirochaetales bacterium]
MNFFNWFTEITPEVKYAPLVVKIESSPVVENTIDNRSNKPEILSESSEQETEIIKPAPVSAASSETVFDPYADLGMSNNSSSSLSEPEPLEEGVRETSHVPSSESKIVLEDLPTNTGTSNLESSNLTSTYSEDNNVSVVSDNELLDLKSAIGGSNDGKVSESVNQSDSENRSFEYKDVPVEFDIPGESRELLTNPPPEIPDDLPSDFPPEITYNIRFSLNPDGLIKVLSITPSSVYPKIDASIRKALRSWTFKGSSDTELVEGTITIIFKGK